jgi:hypothetical protein
VYSLFLIIWDYKVAYFSNEYPLFRLSILFKMTVGCVKLFDF